jgi:hypothetical protein
MGKTYELLKFMREHPDSICLVHSQPEVSRLERENIDLKGRFFSVRSLKNYRPTHYSKVTLCIDNIEMLLPQLTGGFSVGRVTGTGPLIPPSTEFLFKK